MSIWKTTGQAPKALLERPHLPPRLAHYLSVFYEISGGRQYSMAGPQPIATSEIQSYCELLRIDDSEQREFLLRLVRRLDMEWLKEHHRLSEASK